MSYMLNCVPPKRFVGELTPVPQNVIIYGDRVFAEVVKLK